MSENAELFEKAKECGANIVGVADLIPFRGKLPVIPRDLLEEYKYAISMGIILNDSIIDGCKNGPIPSYAQEYTNVNLKLDHIAENLTKWIQSKGHKAEFIPASKVLDSKQLLGAISHKAISIQAGLGWQGKSLLVIHPKYGPRIRYATILTDLPLREGIPLENKCGVCEACVKICPVGAINNKNTAKHYDKCEDAVDLDKCYSKLKEFRDWPSIGKTVCGLCIRVCPYGNPKRRNLS